MLGQEVKHIPKDGGSLLCDTDSSEGAGVEGDRLHVHDAKVYSVMQVVATDMRDMQVQALACRLSRDVRGI